MKDKEFLQWIYDRLKLYGENPNQDFMIRLKSIVTAEFLKDDATNDYVLCPECSKAPKGRGKTRVFCCRTDIQKPTVEEARVAWNKIALHNTKDAHAAGVDAI